MAKYGEYAGTIEDTQPQHNNLVAHLNKEDPLLMRNAGGAGYPFAEMPYVGTAPIVESGSNANGSYVKFSNGIMMCWHTLNTGAGNSADGALWIAALPTWTFPIAFISIPQVFPSVKRLVTVGANPVSVSRPASADVGETAVADMFVYYSSSNASVVTAVSLFAIGSWK